MLPALRKLVGTFVLYVVFILAFFAYWLTPLKSYSFIGRQDESAHTSTRFTVSAIDTNRTSTNITVDTSVFRNNARSAKILPTEYSQCKPHTNIVFFKTHKCGSSTTQSIFLRFGDVRNLTFAMPLENTFGYDHIFSLSNPFNPNMVQELPTKEYNLLAHHCVYNKPGFEALMPSDTFYVTIIRETASVFDSHFAYFAWAKHLKLLNYSNPVEEFMNRVETYDVIPREYNSKRDVVFHHFDYKQKIETDVMANIIISNMEKELDFVMITEYFDESLILLKNKLCWSFEDILYAPQLVRSEAKRLDINESLQFRIRKWNRWDVLLYDRFNASLWRQIEDFGYDKMATELKMFREKRQELRRNCTVEEEGVSTVLKNLRFRGDIKEGTLCWTISRSEPAYTRYIRRKQLDRYNNPL